MNFTRSILIMCTFALAAGCSNIGQRKGPDEMHALNPLRVPGDSALIKRVAAKGDQVYTVKPAAAGGFEWSAATPDAKLFDESGAQVGTHGKGPRWTLSDGGTILGQLPPVQSITVDRSAIPWLQLEAKAGSAAGSLKNVTVIQRVKTTGGLPPREALDAAHVGKELRVPYTADYLFYGKK